MQFLFDLKVIDFLSSGTRIMKHSVKSFFFNRMESKAEAIQATFQNQMGESSRHFQQKLTQSESELASCKAEVSEKSRTLADVNAELATAKEETEVI